jgi:hypothetical protein
LNLTVTRCPPCTPLKPVEARINRQSRRTAPFFSAVLILLALQYTFGLIIGGILLYTRA